MEVGLQADVTCHLVKGWHLKVPLRKKGKRTAETIVFAVFDCLMYGFPLNLWKSKSRVLGPLARHL